MVHLTRAMLVLGLLHALVAGGESATSANLLSGDTSFETGPGEWMPFSSVAPLQIDDTTAAIGRCSLRLPVSSGWICNRWVDRLVKRGETYTISFYARGQDNASISCTLMTIDWKSLAARIVKPDSQWRRYVLTVPPQDRDYCAYVGFGMSAHDGIVWLDGISLQKGNQSGDYAQASSVVLRADIGQPGEVALMDRPLSISLHLAASAGSPSIGSLQVSVRSWDRKDAFFQSNVLVNAENGGAWKLPIDPAPGPGYYLIDATAHAANGAVLARESTAFAVVHPPCEIDPLRSFFGLKPNYVPREALTRIGVRWLSANGMAWNTASEPEPGSFPTPARSLPRYDDPGMAWIATLGIDHAPAWSMEGGLPRSDAIGGFLRAVLARQAHAVSAFELQGEPDLSLAAARGIPLRTAAARYAELLQAVHPLTAAAGKGLQIGVSGVGTPFAEEVFRLAPHSFDIYAIHPYSFPRYIGPAMPLVSGPEDEDFTGKLLAANELVRRAGGRQEIIIGELGWGVDNRASLAGNEARVQADYLARCYLMARSVPSITRLVWFNALGALEAQHYEYGMWLNAGGIKPRPAVAAYATLAHLLEDAEAQSSERIGSLHLHSYRQRDRFIIAAWNDEPESQNDLHLTFDRANSTAIHLLGGPASWRQDGDQAHVTVDGSPVFILSPATQGQAALALARASLRQQQPFSLAIGLSERKRCVLSIAGADAPLQASLRMHLDDNTILAGPSPFTIPAGGALSLPVLLKEPLPLTGGTLTAEITASDLPTALFRRTLSALMRCPSLAEGCWPDLDRAEVLCLDRAEQLLPPDPTVGWKGPSDLSARLAFAWNPSGLVVAVRVTDDIHSNPYAREQIWKGDSIQIGIASGVDGRGSRGYTRDDREFAAALTDSGEAVLWCHQGERGAVKNGNVIVTRVGTTTYYQLVIPWRALPTVIAPQPDGIFGLNLIINENDGAGRTYALGLAPGIAGAKRPARFPLATLSAP